MQTVLIGIVVALLGVSPVHSQSGQEAGSPVLETDQAEPSSLDSLQEDIGNMSECYNLYALGEWNESEFSILLECVFHLSELEVDRSPSQIDSSGVQGSASECGNVNVEYIVQQYLPIRLFGFVRGHQRIYLMYLSCEDGSPAVGYSTGLQETWGPNPSRTSQSCWVPNPRGRGVIEERTRLANGCPSFIGGIPNVAISAHLHTISSRNDNRIRQVIMWADLNRNGLHDIGEPYDTAYSPDDIGSDEFSLQQISRSIGRPGRLAVLTLKLVNKRGEPLSNTSVGADIVSGPSTGTATSCYSPLARIASTSHQGDCATDDEGGIAFAYRVGTSGISSSRQEGDIFQIYIDKNRDGLLTTGEPFRYSDMRIARSATYVALGDSYSSGENGQASGTNFEGSYLSRNPADSACRRWNMAYPFVVDDFLAGTNINVTSYACTGAITKNIYDSESAEITNKPSGSVKNHPNPNWEPRQAVSLERTSHVDMITVTIGGNDAGFADILSACYLPKGCSVSDLSTMTITDSVTSVLEQLKAAAPEAAIFILGYPYITPESVPRECRSLTIAPILDSLYNDLDMYILASILDAIYTNDEQKEHVIDILSSEVGGASLAVMRASVDAAKRSAETTKAAAIKALEALKTGAGTYGRAEITKAEAQTATAESIVTVIGAAFGHLKSAWKSTWVLTAPIGYSPLGTVTGQTDENVETLPRDILSGILATYASIGGLSIDSQEARFLRDAADSLNSSIRRAASTAGVHYVPVANAFDGHSPCASGLNDDWIYGLEGQPTFEPSVYLYKTPSDFIKAIIDGSLGNFFSTIPSPNSPASNRSFHPNTDGHRAYARILSEYIDTATSSGRFELNEAGLPVNPSPVVSPSGSSASLASLLQIGENDRVSSDDQVFLARSTVEQGNLSVASFGEDTSEEDSSIELSLLEHRRMTLAASDCNASLFVSGDRLELSADGFAPKSVVKLAVAGATMTPTVLSPMVLPSVTADTEGSIKTVWSIPDISGSEEDSVPRMYSVVAGGTDTAGNPAAAVMLIPLVAYPNLKPCAHDDSAVTNMGRSVRIPILVNDVAPQGGTINQLSVQVDPVYGGEFSLNIRDGSLTFTPIPGFAGALVTDYVVYDDWGVSLQAEIAITVNAGCTITGTAGTVNIEGTDGNDVICVPNPDDYHAFHIIDAKAGDDIILGGDGVEWIDGGAGRDIVHSHYGKDLINAGTGEDTIYSGGGFDTIYSTDQNDTIFDDPDGYELIIISANATEKTDPVAADDWQHAEMSEVVVVHVLDNDYDPNGDLDVSKLSITRPPTSGSARIVTSNEYGAAIEYTAATASGVDEIAYKICDLFDRCANAQVSVVIGNKTCTIVGTNASDTLQGTDGDDIICGLGGDDTIYGFNGNDTLIGGPGNDMLNGGNGDDTLWGGTGDDRLLGSTGSDVLWGSDGNDTLNGNTQDDTLNGGPGNDRLYGGGHNDKLYAGVGVDTLIGNAGNDVLHGGPGNDMLNGGNGDDTLWGGTGDDRLLGSTGSDVLWGSDGNDTLNGNTQDDTLNGGPGNDRLYGGGHNDKLQGNTGDDKLYGGPGDDTTYGGLGDDTIDGGNGNDYINGGSDTDSCRRGETIARCEI